MGEQYLLRLLARARGSKGGVLLVVVGVFALFVFLIFSLASIVSNVIFTISGLGSVINFLGTGLGVLVGLVVAVIMILAGVSLLMRATPQVPFLDVEVKGDEQEREKLRTELQESKEELKKLQSENRHLAAEVGAKQRQLKQLRAETAELETERDRLKPYENRMRLRLKLREYYREGEKLLRKQPSSDDVSQWDTPVLHLIKDALGDDVLAIYVDTSDQVLVEDPKLIPQQRLKRHLNHLQRIVEEYVDWVPLEPEFDAQKYFSLS